MAVHGLGSGKTLEAVVSSECILDNFPDSEIVIITPTSLQHNMKKEMVNYGVDVNSDEFHEKYHFFTFRSFYNKFSNSLDSEDSEESLERYMKNKLLIVDEVHTIKFKEFVDGPRKPSLEKLRLAQGKDSKVDKVIVEAAKHAFKVLLLTATPVLNKPMDIANLIAMIDGKDPSPVVFNDTIYGRKVKIVEKLKKELGLLKAKLKRAQDKVKVLADKDPENKDVTRANDLEEQYETLTKRIVGDSRRDKKSKIFR